MKRNISTVGEEATEHLRKAAYALTKRGIHMTQGKIPCVPYEFIKGISDQENIQNILTVVKDGEVSFYTIPSSEDKALNDHIISTTQPIIKLTEKSEKKPPLFVGTRFEEYEDTGEFVKKMNEKAEEEK